MTIISNMLLLTGKEKSELLKIRQIKLRKHYFGDEKKFVAVLFFGKNNPSQVYVELKRKYSKEIGFDFLVFGQEGEQYNTEYSDLYSLQNRAYINKEQVIELINNLNNDNRCIGIICQLPLTEELKPFQKEICNSISPIKDIDGLGNKLQEYAFGGKIKFLPATAQAVISLWDAYNLGSFEGKIISVIGQSDIVGRPISRFLQLQGAEVHKFDIVNTTNEIIDQTRKSNIIISCTGALHLIDERFVNKDMNQIIIDVGYGFLNGKSTGDVNFEKVRDKVYAISPVPGGVGPMTVACLFGNIFTIRGQEKKLNN